MDGPIKLTPTSLIKLMSLRPTFKVRRNCYLGLTPLRWHNKIGEDCISCVWTHDLVLQLLTTRKLNSAMNHETATFGCCRLIAGSTLCLKSIFSIADGDFKECPECQRLLPKFHEAVEYLHKLDDGKVGHMQCCSCVQLYWWDHVIFVKIERNFCMTYSIC